MSKEKTRGITVGDDKTRKNLWSNTSSEARKNAIPFKFSKETLDELSKINFSVDDEEKDKGPTMSSNEQAKASKEKTREIKGWVCEYHAPWIKEGVAMPFFPEKPTDGGPLIEATLLIKEPEKTVTISRSQLFRALSESGYAGDEDNARELIEKLFGSET